MPRERTWCREIEEERERARHTEKGGSRVDGCHPGVKSVPLISMYIWKAVYSDLRQSYFAVCVVGQETTVEELLSSLYLPTDPHSPAFYIDSSSAKPLDTFFCEQGKWRSRSAPHDLPLSTKATVGFGLTDVMRLFVPTGADVAEKP